MDKRKLAQNEMAPLRVFSLDYEGRGVARQEGKAIFIKGALPSETVSCRVLRSKKQFDEAEAVAILHPSAERIVPKCGYFDTCGGCSLQHAAPRAQVAYKQRVLEEQLQRIGKVFPEQLLPPIYGMAWGYRQRVRLSVAVAQDGRVKLGFQARKSNDVVAIEACPVLPEYVSAVLPQLGDLAQKLVDLGAKLRFMECLCGDVLTVLNVNIRDMPSEACLESLRQFSDDCCKMQNRLWQVWLQQGREVALPFYPEKAPQLAYVLKEFDVRMPFRPGDFTQINADVNAVMVSRALRMLDIQVGERVADMFCGLGNFSLPMVKQGARVVGIEGLASLTQRARENARLNQCEKAQFQTADLFETDEQTVASWGQFDKMLLDPPRAGAFALVQALHAPYLPRRIVYVSCNPSTFARDAAVLVGKGYRFQSAGVMNMFAQTSHVESIGCFELI